MRWNKPHVLMDTLSVITVLAGLAAILAAASVLLANRRREKRCEAQETTVTKAAREYLAHHQIHGHLCATILPDGSMVLLVETPPHKKLRFSYIIEQPIKHFIRVHTGIEVARIFWRFPLPLKPSQALEVHYADAAAKQGNAREASVTETVPAPDTDDDDNYFQHRTYQIEEVSWENFSSILGNETPAQAPKPKKK